MPQFIITDPQDARLEAFRNLKTTNVTRYQSQMIAEGDKLVERLLQANLPIESLLATPRYADQFEPLLPASTPVYVMPQAEMEHVVGFRFHRGVLACAHRPVEPDLATLCQSDKPLTLVVCPEVHDPENLGAILRISTAFGVQGVLLGSECCDPYSRRVLRVSMGSAFLLPIAREQNLLDQLEYLRREQAFEVWATVLAPRAAAFDSINRPRRLALMLGSEGHGLPDDWQRFADQRVTIPMHAGTDSLNVSVATGILLYELTRPLE